MAKAVTAPPPRRPWWKRKRAWAAVLLWLVIAYPVSYGPACYLAYRYTPTVESRTRSVAWIDAVYEPALRVAFAWPAARPVIGDYSDWWSELGERHAASD